MKKWVLGNLGYFALYISLEISSIATLTANALPSQQPTHICERGLNLIRERESLRLRAYPDPGTKRDPWTIGYGHTGSDVRSGMHITAQEAERLLRMDVAKVEKGILRLVKVPLTQGQFSALVSFAFNCGLDEDEDKIAEGLGDSTLLAKLNRGDYIGAAEEFPKWNKANGRVLKGLVKRRKLEQELFLSKGS